MSHVFFLGSASRRLRRVKSRLRAGYARNGTPLAQGCKNCRGRLRSAYAAQFPFHRGYASYESCRCRLCGGYAALRWLRGTFAIKKHYSDEGSERFLVQVPGYPRRFWGGSHPGCQKMPRTFQCGFRDGPGWFWRNNSNSPSRLAD